MLFGVNESNVGNDITFKLTLYFFFCCKMSLTDNNRHYVFHKLPFSFLVKELLFLFSYNHKQLAIALFQDNLFTPEKIVVYFRALRVTRDSTQYWI